MDLQYDIIIDNTNLVDSIIQYYKDCVSYYNRNSQHDCFYEVEIKIFNTDLKTCIERDSKRLNPVGKDVIVNMYGQNKKLFENT